MAVAATKLEPRTLLSYRQSDDRHVPPTLGSRRHAAVTSGRCGGISSPSLRLGAITGHRAQQLRRAEHGVPLRRPTPACHGEPCTSTDLARSTGEEVFNPYFLTPAQVEAVAAELDEGAPYGLLMRFAASDGTEGRGAGRVPGAGNQPHAAPVLVRRSVQRIRGG